MAVTEVIEMEARLKNFISGELNQMTKDIEKFGRTTEDNMKGATKHSSTFMGTLKGFVTGGLILGGLSKGYGLLSDAMREGWQEAKEAQEAQIKLSAALGYTSSALNAQAKAQAQLTLFEDDQVTAAQASMANMIKDETIIKRLIPLAEDLATAKGIDLVSASNLLTKAIVSSDGSLRGYGIKLEGTAGSTQRVESAVKTLTAAFGGQAQAIAQSDLGKIEQLNKQIRDMKEAAMTSAIPALSSIATYVENNILPAFDSWIEKIGRVMNPRDTAKKKTAESIYRGQILEASDLRVEIEKLKAAQKDFGGMSVLGGQAATKTIKSKEEELKNLISSYQKLGRTMGIGGQPDKPKGKILTSPDGGDSGGSKTSQPSFEEVMVQMGMPSKGAIEYAKEQAAELDALKASLLQEQIATAVGGVEGGSRAEQQAAEMQALKDSQSLELEQYRTHGENITMVEQIQGEKRKQLNQKYNKENIDASKKERDAKVANAFEFANEFGGTLSMMAKASKASANVQKGIAIGQAVLNTAASVAKTAAVMGYPAAIPFIALAIANGVAQTAIIASQKFATGGVVPGVGNQDSVNAMLTPGEMILNDRQQSNLFDMLNRPNTSTTNNSTTNAQNVHLNLNVAPGGNYDMAAAQYTVDQLKPIIGKALVEAHKEGQLNDYYNVR